MAYLDWQPGIHIVPPVYLDSGVLIAAIVRKEPRYPKAAALIADLLIDQVEIVISVLTLSETLWGLAKLSYCELYHHPSRVAFNPSIFRRHCVAIFQAYASRMNLMHDIVRDWLQAGIPVQVIPTGLGDMQQASRSAPEYMHTFQLASADAMHLALAVSQARSFVTTDSDFQLAASASVEIIHIPL